MKNENLNWFKKFCEICEENNIYYSVMFGTLIGTIREKGPIEWDDDFDVIMTPASYERLKKLFPSNCLDGLSNPEYPLVIPKFTPNISNYLETKTWVDIFLLTKTNKDNIKRYTSFKSKFLYSIQIFKSKWEPNSIKVWLFKVLSFPFWFLKPKFNYKKALSILNKGKKELKPLHYITNSVFVPKEGSIFENMSFSPIKKPFSDFYVYVPEDYHRILTQRFDNYMIPINDGRKHSSIISVKKNEHK